MTRISKDPEERKSEIIAAALQLFNQKGFEATAVSDIVQKIGIAQGTFYYYFGSKDELLDQVMEQFVEQLMQAMDVVVQNKELDAIQKLRQIIRLIFSIGKDLEGPVVEYVHEEKNAVMHQKFSGKVLKMLGPVLLHIIEEGKTQGLLNSDYTEEALEILLHGFIDYVHEHYFCKDRDLYNRKIEALVDVFERLFGAPRGALKIT